MTELTPTQQIAVNKRSAEIYTEEMEKQNAKLQEKQGVTANFNANSIDDMRKAAELATKRLNELQADKNTPEIERITAERDDYRNKLELLAQQAFEKKHRELNAPSDITDPESLMAYEKGLKANQTANPSGFVGGTPLSEAQYGIQRKQGAFSSHEEMINALIVHEKAGNTEQRIEAKKALDAMTIKVLKGSKDGNVKGFDFPANQSIPDIINENHRKKFIMTKRD